MVRSPSVQRYVERPPCIHMLLYITVIQIVYTWRINCCMKFVLLSVHTCQFLKCCCFDFWSTLPPLLFIAISSQAYGHFSTECARYKDLIHLHSFMYDFHLNLVLGMLNGEREMPEWLDVRAFLEHFMQENKVPASFIRNRLERG